MTNPTSAKQITKKRGRRALSFVKWAGSKAYVMDRILELLPHYHSTYYEPMVGSGTVFLTLRPATAVLSDVNAELMNCYQVIRGRLDELLAALDRHENTKQHFLAVRAQEADALSPVERAARTIFLNKTCFNGLYRVNSRGKFNVPFGDIGWANIRDAEALGRIHQLLQRATLRCCDYEQSLEQARCGDLIYFDPPYLSPGTKPTIFYAYQPTPFGLAEHRRLAETFRRLDRRGCHVVLSNSDVPQIHELYRGYPMKVISTRRPMNCVASRREGWKEVVVHNIRGLVLGDGPQGTTNSRPGTTQ